MFKKLILLLPLLSAFASFSQEFAGIVVDEFGNPLPKANIYFNGSTKGVETNDDGEFEIQIPEIQNKILVISYMGYETLYIDDFSRNYQTYQLKPKQESLEDVVIVDSKIPEEKLLDVFKKLFLGIDPNGKNCVILNEDAINIRFDPNSNTVIANSKEDLLILNERLNYKIRYDLIDFEAKFESDKIKGSQLIHSFFVGTNTYQDIGETQKKHEIARSVAFQGSIRHFFQALYHKSLSSEKFRIVKYKKGVKGNKIFTFETIGNAQKLNLKDYALRGIEEEDVEEGDDPTYSFVVEYKGYEISVLKFNTDHIYINKYGDYAPLQKVLINGEMSYKKLGSMLPSDYIYE